MMQGSGPADRDNDVLFPPIRAALIERGLAVYSFDKPGVGASEGDWREHALEDRVSQVMGAIEMLRARPDLDAARIGVFGHSQGGWMAQMLASRVAGLAFALANSGPSIDVAAQNRYGCEHTMRARGHPDPEIQAALRFFDRLHREAATGTAYDEIEPTLEEARQQPWYGYLPIDDAHAWGLMCRFIQEGYQPLDALRSVACPFLAVYGGLDLLLPAWEGARATGEALRAAPSTDTTVVVFPEGDHRIQQPDGGQFVAGYLELVTGWVARVVKS